MSKALYKSGVQPELIHRFTAATSRSIEIWTTTCIVTNFRKKATVLVNPSNPQLSGVKNFPYFPRGGPVPDEIPRSMHKDWQPLGFVSQWGGMEVGSGMLYPVSVVDGLVHHLGGWRLQAECRLKAIMAKNSEACPVGHAVVTSSGSGKLREFYEKIVHTTPPFFRYHDNPQGALGTCYENALHLAFKEGARVATPLLGAGARGFPIDEAISVAATAAGDWSQHADASPQVLLFGLLEVGHANHLMYELEKLKR
ncbi:Macro domain [Fragilaria crotonensis]|nr:Macro domain [Fragilaria crotonensis]